MAEKRRTWMPGFQVVHDTTVDGPGVLELTPKGKAYVALRALGDWVEEVENEQDEGLAALIATLRKAFAECQRRRHGRAPGGKR